MSKLDKLLKDYYLYMKYHETAADSKVSHTTVSTSMDDANILHNGAKQAIKELFLELIGEDTFDGSVTDAAQNLYKAELRKKVEEL